MSSRREELWGYFHGGYTAVSEFQRVFQSPWRYRNTEARVASGATAYHNYSARKKRTEKRNDQRQPHNCWCFENWYHFPPVQLGPLDGDSDGDDIHSRPLVLWAWLELGAGARDSAGTQTGTGTASPATSISSDKNNLNNSNITIFNRGSDSNLIPPPHFPFPRFTNNKTVSSSSSSASSDSSDPCSFAFCSGPGFDNFNLFLFDTVTLQHQRARRASLFATTHYQNTTNPIHNNNNNPNIIHDSPLSPDLASALDTFFPCSPSTSSFSLPIDENDHHTIYFDWCKSLKRNSRYNFRKDKMAGSTLAAPDGAYFTNATYTAANMTANSSQWRPHTSRSGRSAGARSPSPLFARWARRNQKEHDQLDTNDSRSSTDRKSISSSGTSRRFQRHQNSDPDNHNHNHDNLAHTYNSSTSTNSLKRQSQSGLPPPLTREEFEALPVAIQRKVCCISNPFAFMFLSHFHCVSSHFAHSLPYPLAGILGGHWSCRRALMRPCTQ